MANPFLALKRIREIIVGRHPAGDLPYLVDEVSKAVIEHTNIDYVEFIEFDDPDNPISGRYEKYSPIEAYTPPITYVEICYSSDCNLCWARYTICKELCHALLDDDAMCVSDPKDVEVLIGALTSETSTRERLSSIEPFKSEKLAELLALELLCPVEERRSIYDARASGRLTISDMKIALEYRIPVAFVPTIFSLDYISIIERLLKSDE